MGYFLDGHFYFLIHRFMQLHTQKLALAATETVGIAYALCAAFTALWPDIAVKLVGSMMHILNIEKYAADIQMTWGGFFTGLIEVMVYAYLFTFVLGFLYNRMVKQG